MKDVPKNMRLTGMLLFRGAFMEALQGEKLMCVVHAAHAAEILLKARIAQEHPLLIFSKLPEIDNKKETPTFIDLIEKGYTFSYTALPDQLWAVTGIKLNQNEIKQYKEFGKLRNQIIHTSIVNADKLNVRTLRFSLDLLDPLAERFWGRSVIEFIINDPHNDYPLAFLENEIRQHFTIDQRLRRSPIQI